MENDNTEKINEGEASGDTSGKFGEVSEEDIRQAKEAEPEDIKEKPSINVVNEILDWCESFVFAMFIVILIFTFFFRVVLVDGDSMNDTLIDKDRLVMTHINYTPEKGDIVVINSEVIGKTIIKRVIGTEGDQIKVDYTQNTVTVNGEEISGEHNKEVMVDTGLFDISFQTSEGVYEYEVPDDCVFVMGDNRNNSKDSRAIGFIPEDDVLGKAVLRLFPFNGIGFVD
ncbi:MAG: signal peptidase I [Ruminococcus sp.]|nr:signal peptidase I [Ruminococcus sp.]